MIAHAHPRQGKAAVIIAILLGVLAFSCAGCLVLGFLARSMEPVELVNAKPLTRRLTLSASQGNAEQLDTTLRILRRRLETAGIEHAIDRSGMRFSVRFLKSASTS